jgi:hypothetical protein
MAGAPRGYVVVFDPDAAVLDLGKISSKSERKAIFNAVDKLRHLGPLLVTPHAKSLKGEPDLFELRPRQGSSASRPVYMRWRDDYVVLAVSKDHDVDMAASIADAKARAARYP